MAMVTRVMADQVRKTEEHINWLIAFTLLSPMVPATCRADLLTNAGLVSKVSMQGRVDGPFFLPAGWEVVQLAVHQTLDLIILVRVQASQPIFLSPRKTKA